MEALGAQHPMSSQRPNRAPSELFERLVREHHAAVHAAALRVTRDDALALDVTQQVFVRVLEGKLDVAQAVDVQRWLRCAAAREALMALRASSSRRRREEQHAMRRPESFEDRSTESADTLAALRRALLELPDDLRAALVLRFQEELTFDEMSDVLSISAPSAHQRVQRGLEKLRDKLKRAGLGALCVDVEGWLGKDRAVGRAPAGLESELLALAGASSSSVAVGAGVLAVAVLTGLSAWYVARRDAGQASLTPGDAVATAPLDDTASNVADEELESVDRRAVAANSRESSTRNDRGEPAALEPGRIEGRVVDEFALPLEGVLVRAVSVERDGKFAAQSAETHTARDGTFALSVPVLLGSGQDYRLSTQTAQSRSEVEALRVRAGETALAPRIVVPSELAPRPGEWQLELTLRDAQGAPIDGALVRAHVAVRETAGHFVFQQHAASRSARGGLVELAGNELGPKVLAIDARELGFAPLRERFECEQAGRVRREIVLERGVELIGSIVDDRGAPITRERLGADLNTLCAAAEGFETWFYAEFPAPGRFVIRALSPTPHELRFRHSRWSAFKLAVTPGGDELELRLKRKDDVTGRGQHDAEIHGALFDAASGASLENEIGTTWLHPVASDSPALVDGDWAPLAMQPVIAQTAMGFGAGEDLPPAPPANAFIYDGLEPGRYLVRVFAEGYAPALIGPIELREREIASGFAVGLTRGATVSGVVRDVDGTPLANAHVHLLGDGALSHAQLDAADRELRSTGGRGHLYYRGAATDAQGRFSRAHTPTDRALRLYVLHPEREPAAGAWLELREGASVEHELRAGPVRER